MPPIDKTWLDTDTAHGNSTTTLVYGCGPSTVPAVRAAETDWTLIPYAPPALRATIDAGGVEGDRWLRAIIDMDDATAQALNLDSAVRAHSTAWRAVSK